MILYIALILCSILLIAQFFKTRNVANLIIGVFFGAYSVSSYLGGFNIIISIVSIAIIFLCVILIKIKFK